MPVQRRPTQKICGGALAYSLSGAVESREEMHRESGRAMDDDGFTWLGWTVTLDMGCFGAIGGRVGT